MHKGNQEGGRISPRDTIRYALRMTKKDSTFIYFQLEANEGLCFYSTRDEPQKSPYRTVEIVGHISLKDQLDRVLGYLRKSVYFDFL